MPTRLHILIADPHTAGGGQVRYVVNTVHGLVQKEHLVTVACREQSRIARALSNQEGVNILPFHFQAGLRIPAWVSDIQKAVRVLRQQAIDVVHVNSSQDHWVFALANQYLRRPAALVRTRHNTYPVKSHVLNRWLNRTATDYQIVVCNIVRRALAQNPAFDERRLCTVYSGVDTDLFHPDESLRAEMRAALGYTDQHVVFGIVARLVKAKGHEFLFRAAAQLFPTYPQLRILVLGEGPLEQDLQRLCRELGIHDAVTFCGFRQDVAAITQAFDVAVLPSIDCDTSPYSLKEAMACEKPCIGSDHGGIPELLTDGVEGIVVPAGQIIPLAGAMRRLIVDSEARMRMGKAGRRRVLQDFSLEVGIQRTLDAYHRALEIHRERLASG
jgi:glycosyltransferase involved in cell wall biosynthesis